MFTVKYKLGNQFCIEKYDYAAWRDRRAARLITQGFTVTLAKQK